MIWLVATAWADGQCRAWSEPVERGTLAGHEEVSGLAAARVDAGSLFFHEDDGGKPALVRFTEGADLQSDVPVDGLDWEDVAIGACPSGIDACDCVCLGDIGDNLANRAAIQVVWFPEPAPGEVVAPTIWQLTWPDLPRDAEAMITDADATVYVIAKDGSAIGVASGPGVLTVVPGPDVDGDDKIIAASVSPNGRRVALRTESHLWLYLGEDVLDALVGEPLELPAPDDDRQEAMTFAADGRSIWLTGEGIDPKIYQVNCVQFTDDDTIDAIDECIDATRVGHVCGCGSESNAGLLACLVLIGLRRARG